ncbi:acyl-homoserine-lactone synthase [Nitrospirillum amazonense]|uniref:acyl-homoserine-lactone synthase n=1 Tax=Nitrospirillum amazonense TaxID=28077 RepID=UPI0024125F23|nr:acyl-homoserine-lactone synthase [Nitrospirillum amazonense]MDG3444559.1 acyl-homoserine-lactone synthase [Nitrospirillum amazonense]
MTENHINPTVSIFNADTHPKLMGEAWHLRYRLFKCHLGWELETTIQAEADEFDEGALHCGIIVDGVMLGYWRALPTTKPYLLNTRFSFLLKSQEDFPKADDVWEISRFAIDPTLSTRQRRRVGQVLSSCMAAFAAARGASTLIGLAEPAFMNFLRRQGLPLQALTSPSHVGNSTAGAVHALLVSVRTVDIPPALAAPYIQQFRQMAFALAS